MNAPAAALCITGGLVVVVGLLAADRFERAAMVALLVGCVAMWAAFWLETLE